jgi:hypothetical protein
MGLAAMAFALLVNLPGPHENWLWAVVSALLCLPVPPPSS